MENNMSNDWPYDINKMHEHYKIYNAISKLTEDKEKLHALLQFRISFLNEELNELKDATNAEDVVDALIDLCVVAIGTLDIFGIDPYKAWDEVLKANMNKTPGVNPSRPNPLNLPDLIKPAGWSAPSHAENHGNLGIIFNV
jgi:predicted HAD superfamily Cof-like phosphohydrolase